MVVEVLVLVAHHTNNYYSKQKHLKRLSTKIPKYCFQLFVRASMPAPTLISQAYTVFSNLDNVMQSLRFRCFLNSNFFHNSICYCVSKSHHAWPYPTPPPQNPHPIFFRICLSCAFTRGAAHSRYIYIEDISLEYKVEHKRQDRRFYKFYHISFVN